jgi:hypothetical protein
VRIWLFFLICKLEAIAGIWTPEQDNVCDHATNLINQKK